MDTELTYKLWSQISACARGKFKKDGHLLWYITRAEEGRQLRSLAALGKLNFWTTSVACLIKHMCEAADRARQVSTSFLGPLCESCHRTLVGFNEFKQKLFRILERLVMRIGSGKKGYLLGQ